MFYQGLDRTAVLSVMQMFGVKDTKTVLAQIRLIESGALKVLNKPISRKTN